jgi:hypothetical protein
MCNKALNWAWTLPLPTDAQCLTASYTDMANEAGDCSPGLRLSQQRTGVKRDRIALLNRAFVAAGLLTIVPGKPGSARNSHTYHLNVGKKLAKPLKIRAPRRGRWPPTDPVGYLANPFRQTVGKHLSCPAVEPLPFSSIPSDSWSSGGTTLAVPNGVGRDLTLASLINPR